MLELTQTHTRKRLDEDDDVAALRKSGVLIEDPRRRRSLFFDGRFLAGADLTREQNYFLSRQADVGRACGTGVIRGLMVERDPNSPSSIRITAGEGVSEQGEVLVLPETLTADIGDLATMQRLDRAVGLSTLPRAPGRNLTGLFIVALRPVEFTANEIASYPTEINGRRGIHDGDIIEAVIVTLIPYADAADGQLDSQRSRAARDIFVERNWPRIPPGALPLAIVGLRRQLVEWVDPFLVRRELDDGRAGQPGFGLASRAEASAYFNQYEFHLSDVTATIGGSRFSASQFFASLPPAGRFPHNAIDPRDFTQIYFPAEADVDVAVVPDDELPVLLDEGLDLPPIDLTLSNAQLASTSLLALVPIARVELQTVLSELASHRRALKQAAPGSVARRRPVEILRGLVRRPSGDEPNELDDGAWRRLLAAADEMWYVRRRQVPIGGETAASVMIEAPRDDVESPPVVIVPPARRLTFNEVVEALDFRARLETILENSTETAAGEIDEFFRRREMRSEALLAVGFLRELEQFERVQATSARRVMRRFDDTELAAGTQRLAEANPDLAGSPDLIRTVTESPGIDEEGGIVPELATLAMRLESGPLKQFATTELPAAAESGGAAITKLVAIRLQET